MSGQTIIPMSRKRQFQTVAVLKKGMQRILSTRPTVVPSAGRTTSSSKRQSAFSPGTIGPHVTLKDCKFGRPRRTPHQILAMSCAGEHVSEI